MFPHIFFRGTGGMYHLRRIQVTPTMFGRWILKQTKQTLLLVKIFNMYLVYLIGKIFVGIDSGIFASLRSSRMPNLNAKQLLEKINKKDQVLESNLSTVFHLLETLMNFGDRNAVI